MTNQLQQQQPHLHHHQQHQQPQRRSVNVRIPAIEKYAYCLCLHVKPTTIFIAVFKLIRALLFASMILNNEFTSSEQFSDPGMALEDRHRSTTAAVSILTRIIMASVSAVGIYAVVSGKAGLLMPLYAVLLVDFFFALPAFYNRDVDPSFADSLDDLRNYSAGNKQYTRYSLMLFSTITMIVKIYFLCVVWKCYRYLRLIELVAPIRLTEIYPHMHHTQHAPRYPIVRVVEDSSTDLSGGIHSLAPPPYDSIASSMKPPNYEEAIKSTTINFASVYPSASAYEPQPQLLPPPPPPPPPTAATTPIVIHQTEQQQQQQQLQVISTMPVQCATSQTPELLTQTNVESINDNPSEIVAINPITETRSCDTNQTTTVTPQTITVMNQPNSPANLGINNSTSVSDDSKLTTLDERDRV